MFEIDLKNTKLKRKDSRSDHSRSPLQYSPVISQNIHSLQYQKQKSQNQNPQQSSSNKPPSPNPILDSFTDNQENQQEKRPAEKFFGKRQPHRFQNQGDVIFHIGGVTIMNPSQSEQDKNYQKFEKKTIVLDKILKSKKFQDIISDPLDINQSKSQPHAFSEQVHSASGVSRNSQKIGGNLKVESRSERSNSGSSKFLVKNSPKKQKSIKIVIRDLEVSKNFNLEILQNTPILKKSNFQQVSIMVISIFQICSNFEHKLSLLLNFMILIVACQNYQKKIPKKLNKQQNLQFSSPIIFEANNETKPVLFSKEVSPFLDNSKVEKNSSSMQPSESDFSISDENKIIDRVRPRNDSTARQQSQMTLLNLQRTMLKDIILRHVSQGAMLCKIYQKRASKKMSQADVQRPQRRASINLYEKKNTDSYEIRLGEPFKKIAKLTTNKQRKIELEVIEQSDRFNKVFEIHYKLWNIPYENDSLIQNSCSSQKLDSPFKPPIFSDSNNSLVNPFSAISAGGQNYRKIKTCQPKFRKSSFSGFEKQMPLDVKEGLSLIEQQMMEFKIYMPYFISNETIIQYQSSLKQASTPKKLSIMDILEAHFLDKKTTSRLFFKVDLTDEIDNSNLKFNFDEPRSSFSQSFVNKKQTFESPEMEDIIETTSLLEMEKNNSIQSGGSMPEKVSESAERSYKRILKRSFSSDQLKFNHIESNIRRSKLYKANSSQLNCRLKKAILSESKSSLSSENTSKMESYLNKSISGSSDTSKTSQFYDNEYGGHQQHKTHGVNEDKTCYFEFEIRQIKDTIDLPDLKNLTFLNIKDVTTLVKNQKKFFDKTYQDAIENNYSHEQMTPLNPIMNFAPVVKNNIINLYSQITKMPKSQTSTNQMVEGFDILDLSRIIYSQKDAKQNLQNVISIEQSAKSIWFYNTNQIKRMKIKKNQLKVEPTASSNMISTVWNVIWPFEHYIFKRRVNIYLIRNLMPNYEMVADWNLYELVIFNILQNALKYNKNFDGDIVLTMTCKKIRVRDQNQQKNNFVFETQVIDSGIGIQKDRQKLLFIPFQELNNRIGISQSANESIGLGLACSSDICKQMGGDITLKKSEAGLTVIAFKFPVTLNNHPVVQIKKQDNEASSRSIIKDIYGIEEHMNSNQIEKIANNNEIGKKLEFIQLIGNNRGLSENLKDHLQQNNLLNKNKDLFQVLRKKSGSSKSISKSKSSVLPSFKELYSFPNQKIGFQLLENIEKQCHSSLSGKQSEKSSVNSFLSKLNESKINKYNYKNLNGFLKKQSFQRHQSLFEINGDDLIKKKNSGNSRSRKVSIESFNKTLNNQNKVVLNKSSKKLLKFENASLTKLNLCNSIQSLQLEEVKVSVDNRLQMEVINEFEDEQYSVNSYSFEAEKVSDSNPFKLNGDRSRIVSGGFGEFLENQFENNLSQHLSSKKHLKKLRVKPFAPAQPSQEEIEQIEQEVEYLEEQQPQVEVQNNIYKQLSRMDLQNIDQTKKLYLAKQILEQAKVQKLIDKMMKSDYKPLEPKKRKFQHQGKVTDILIDIDTQLIKDKGLQKYKKQLFKDNIIYDLSESSPSWYKSCSHSYSSSSSPPSVVAPQLEPLNIISSKLNSQEPSDFDLAFSEYELDNNSVSSDSSGKEISQDQEINRQVAVGSQRVINLDNQRFWELIQSNRDKNCDCEPKILIVEDTEFNMMTVCSMVVSKFQIKPFEAQNGQIAVDMVKEALQKPCNCENRAYKYIIMDINMPIKDGYQATEEILTIMKRHGLQEARIEEVDKFCNIVALTSYTGVDVEMSCLGVNMKEVYNKPLQASQLKASINKYFFQGEENLNHFYQMRMLRDEISQRLSSNNL